MNSCNHLYGFLILILVVIVIITLVNRGKRKYSPLEESDKEKLSRLRAYSFGFPTYESQRYGYPWYRSPWLYRRRPWPYYPSRHYYGYWW